MALNLMDSLGTWRTYWSPIPNRLHLQSRNAADDLIKVKLLAIVTHSEFVAPLVRDSTCGWSCRFSRLGRKHDGIHQADPGSQDLDYQTAAIRMCRASHFS